MTTQANAAKLVNAGLPGPVAQQLAEIIAATVSEAIADSEATAFGLSILGAADASAARTLLELGDMALQNAATLDFSGVPTSDPTSAGLVWVSTNDVVVSAGA